MVWYQSRTLNDSSTSMIYSIPELLMLSKFSLMTNIRNVITSKDLPPQKKVCRGNKWIRVSNILHVFPLSPTCVRKLFLSPTKCFSVKCYKKDIKNLYLFICLHKLLLLLLRNNVQHRLWYFVCINMNWRIFSSEIILVCK